MNTAEIRHIYISPIHNSRDNFYNDAPMEERAEVLCQSGSGIVGDRYFNHKIDYKGQITFFAEETANRIREQFGLPMLFSGEFRRNVVTAELDLNELIGVEFELQGVRFFGTEEARPCEWMNQLVAPGVRDALEGRGGLRARILSNGRLQTGPANWRRVQGELFA